MGTIIQISGAIDRREPDPTAALDKNRAFLGMIVVTWAVDRSHTAMAAVLQVATGGGAGYEGWGDTMLCLNWIGTAPSPEVARAVYDAIQDRGPTVGAMDMTIQATDRASEHGSYTRARRAS